MSDDTASKKEDFIAVAKEAIEASEQTFSSGGLDSAVDGLLAAEKKCRLAGEAFPTADICVQIVKLCYRSRNLDALNQRIVQLSKRRAQLSHAIVKLVQEAMTYISEIDERDPKVELINTLRTVTEGKIAVEVERARLTRQLSQILESEGKVNEASETLQEVQVETYGAMEQREKIEFILDQLRLCLAQRDWIRLQIISRKISEKQINSEEWQDLKIRYYELLIELHTQQRDPWKLCMDYQAIFTTPTVQADAEERSRVLSYMVLYMVLTKWGPEQSDLLRRTQSDKVMEDIPVMQTLLKLFTTDEIIYLPIPGDADISAHPVFTAKPEIDWTADMRKRIIQHNIRTIAKYYDRVRFPRLCQHLGLEAEEAEIRLSEMVSDKDVYAKIDRPAGIVNFKQPKPATETLTDWGNNVSTLLATMENTCHLINKEKMVHKY